MHIPSLTIQKKIITSFFFYMAILADVSSQFTYHVTHLTIEDGLPSPICNNGFMDAKGYMWVTTDGGLSKYDGISFQNYMPQLNDSLSSGESKIWDIKGSTDGMLWVLTSTCLFKFHQETESFEKTSLCLQRREVSGVELRKIALVENDLLWLCGVGGIFKYDMAQDTFYQYAITKRGLNSREQYDENLIDDLVPCIGDDNKFWACGSGLFIFDKSTGEFSLKRKLRYGKFLGLYTNHPNEVWCGTYQHGLEKYDERRDTHIVYKINDRDDFVSNGFLFFLSEDESHFWVCTRSQGLVLFDNRTGHFSFPKEDLTIPVLKDENTVLSAFKDRQGRLWAFTKNGIKIFDNTAPFFKSYQLPTDGFSKNRSHIMVMGMEVDDEGNYWIAGQTGRLFYKADSLLENFEQMQVGFPPNNIVFQYSFWTLLIDSQNGIWTSQLKLFRFNKEKQILEKFKPGFFENKIKRTYISELIEAENGDIYMGTGHQGLLRYDRQKDTIIQYLSNEKMKSIWIPAAK